MRKAHGVTTLGLIFILIVLGVLGYVFLPKILGPSDEDITKKLKVDFDKLYNGLDQYRYDNGAYPTTEQGLMALIERPTSQPVPRYWKKEGYVIDIPLDPWGQPYQYTNNYNVIRVFSFGSGGQYANTEIDISNVNKR